MSIVPDYGWLSPDGKFYSCDHYQHDKTAMNIIETENIYPDDSGSYTRTLENYNWIRIHYTGEIILGYSQMSNDITQAQLDWMFDSSNTDDRQWNKNMLDNIHFYTQA